MKTLFTHPLLGPVEMCASARARRITVTVRRDGSVRLSFPRAAGRKRALEFLESRIAWAKAARERQLKRHAERMLEMPFATRSHVLRFDPCAAERIAVRIAAGEVRVCYPLSMRYTEAAVQQAARDGITEALRREARVLLPPMVAALAAREGLRYGSVRVRAMRTRWGSCSARDDISLNIYLLLLPDHLIEYVIVHELCHTVHHDHSARFHALVDRCVNGRERALARELRGYRPGL